MSQQENTRSTYPGLSDMAFKVAMRERDRRQSMGLKSSIAAVISEAVIKVFGTSR